MQFKFDANQGFQLQAIEAVAGLLEGQPRLENELYLSLGANLAAIANRLDLDEADLTHNLRQVQKANGLPQDDGLQVIESEIETAAGRRSVRFANFSVEMETGTGKTYVYLRTALELYHRYGLRKFIVVVPSVAIREGVLKTLQITETHLRGLYDNVPCRYYVYDSANLSQVRQFARSDGVEFMVLTIDSFNKASNIIRQTTDRLQGEMPIHLVQAARPVLILDEPQNMESELRIGALAALDPVFALRYSATHRNPYNLVYRLTPYEAYRQGLVKRIEVAGVEKEADENRVFLRLDEVRSEKKTLTARIAVHKLMKDGTVKEKVVTVRPGESLEAQANRPEYAAFVIEEMDAGAGSVLFTNRTTLTLGESRGADKEAIFDSQIRYTLGEHFRKQARLRERGIKVLSLFFIDRVDNYAPADGLIRRLFERAFLDLRLTFPDWKDVPPESVQAAYFAARRTKEGQPIYEDSKTGESEGDREAYDLIMKDKERLLSFDEPTCFIFSHSALREGWDNPNVFQICTLNQTTSEVKKRQEIGRGVRLPVNQDGDRVRDEHVNVLTVVANESYEHYVSQYQTEIETEFGRELPPRLANARARGLARLRKEYLLRPEFEELWERIKHKTRYAVRIDAPQLIADVVEELNRAEIRPPHVEIRKAKVETEGEAFVAVQVSEHAAPYTTEVQPFPNLVEVLSALLERTSPPVRLTRRTLLEIFKQASPQIQAAALKNPFEYATVAARIIKAKLTDQLVNGIQYEKINQWYEMTQFEDIPGWSDNLVPAEHSVYDNVVYDSEVEKAFVEGLERREDVKLYVKLPAWFTVPTPVGEYNPDWAVVMEVRDEHGQPAGKPLLYLVRETKDKDWQTSLRPDERRKIQCGERHFSGALKVPFKVITGASELP
ncbi:MAG: DEAD/DEAH box helicase family protein [Anaerolineales bacterium]|jgi:type III restriction enzyme